MPRLRDWLAIGCVYLAEVPRTCHDNLLLFADWLSPTPLYDASDYATAAQIIEQAHKEPST